MDTLASLLSMVKLYVQRQEIPSKILNQLRPDLVLLTEKAPIELVLEMVEKYGSKVPQKGRWGENGEWEYFIHGSGCRVTYTETSEPIDWDAPNQSCFDKFAFLRWLDWLLANNRNADVIVFIEALKNSEMTMEAFVWQMLDKLEQTGRIRCLSPWKNAYELVG